MSGGDTPTKGPLNGAGAWLTSNDSNANDFFINLPAIGKSTAYPLEKQSTSYVFFQALISQLLKLCVQLR